jgi:Tfp pilus assembly protein PilF
MRRVVGPVFGFAVMALVGCQSTVGPEAMRQADAYRNLGAMHLQRGRPEASIREYTRALKANPRDARAHFGIGEAYRQRGDVDVAEAHLLEALEHDPELLEARLNLGALYVEQGRWEESIQQNVLLVEDPMFLLPERALVNLGWAEYKSGNLDSAQEHLMQAVQTNPRNLHGHLNLGVVLYDRADYIEAATSFVQVLKILEDRPAPLFAELEAQTRFRLAQTYIRLGQREQALEHLHAASEKGGSGEWGQRSRSYLQVMK